MATRKTVSRGGREEGKEEWGQEGSSASFFCVLFSLCFHRGCFSDLLTPPLLAPSLLPSFTGIDFKFDNAGFDLGFLPFRVPYPVPFRLLNDEVKGWLQVTYMSPRLRLSRGNKGTIFVLQKVEEE